jgi:acyl-CoA thioester hydrolase
MLKKYTSTYQIRFYECDTIGHLNNANYLKLMQEAAFEASAAVGYDRQKYEKLGQIWLIRETEIEYYQPILFFDQVNIVTWVSDIHRVRSIREYEFHNTHTNNLAAKARTDWVYLDRESLRPTTVPKEVQQAYLDPDELPNPLRRTRFPDLPAPASEVFTIRKRVEWRDLDPWGHVHNSVYLSYVEDCGMQIAAAYGWPWKRMESMGFAIVARRHHIEYRVSALMDDELEISTWVSSIRRSTGIRHYLIKRVSDGEIIARCHSLYVWVDLKSLRPIRIPEIFLNTFLNNISTEHWNGYKAQGNGNPT